MTQDGNSILTRPCWVSCNFVNGKSWQFNKFSLVWIRKLTFYCKSHPWCLVDASAAVVLSLTVVINSIRTSINLSLSSHRWRRTPLGSARPPPSVTCVSWRWLPPTASCASPPLPLRIKWAVRTDTTMTTWNSAEHILNHLSFLEQCQDPWNHC
jgi:hypothetical protein